MKALAFIGTMALASGVLAQAPSGEQPKGESKPRPALNLRLDDASVSPRISFDKAPSEVTKSEREKGLPELGGKTSDALNRPMDPNAAGSPIPRPMEPARNYDTR